MGKALLSLMVVGGLLYAIYLTQGEGARETACAAPESESPLAQTALTEGSEKESEAARASMRSDGSHEEELSGDPFTEPSFDLAAPKRELPGDSGDSSEQAPASVARERSGELVLGNTPADTRAEASSEVASAVIPPAQDTLHVQGELPPERSEQGTKIYFAFDSYTLSSAAETELQRLAEQIRDDAALRIQIAGFTDSVGDPEVNKAFSAARAQTVYNHLLSLGVPSERMRILSFGSAGAAGPRPDPRGRMANRRVEISFVR